MLFGPTFNCWSRWHGSGARRPWADSSSHPCRRLLTPPESRGCCSRSDIPKCYEPPCNNPPVQERAGTVMRRVSLTFVLGVAIALDPRLVQTTPARSRSSTGRPRASSIVRFRIRRRSRKRRRRSRPTRATLRASSTSASRSPARGSSAKRLRRSRAGSRSSRTTRCCCDGAGIGIFPSVNSIGPSPISRAALASTARSTASGITSESSSTCAESLLRPPHRLPGRSPSPRIRASSRVPPTGCGCRSVAPVAARKRKRCSIAGPNHD